VRVQILTFIFITKSPGVEFSAALQTGNTAAQGFVTEKSPGFRD